jgi:hypothetical protein
MVTGAAQWCVAGSRELIVSMAQELRKATAGYISALVSGRTARAPSPQCGKAQALPRGTLAATVAGFG